MSEQTCGTVEGKERTVSDTSIDPSPTHQDDDVRKEIPADTGSCQRCHLILGVVVVMATLIIFTKILLSLLLFAPEIDQSSKTSQKELMEQLQQCQKERRDLELMLQMISQDSRCRLCPDDWLWWRGHCYFFSVGLQENRQWSNSAEFCHEHNSTLVVIKDSAEMEFMQRVMNKYPQFPFPWLGLTDSEQEGRWLWWDGTDIQHYMQLAVEWDTDHRDCADLRGGGRLFAADCESYSPWVCKKAS